MNWNLKLLMVGYFGGALLFAACLVVVLTNIFGLTDWTISGWAIIGSFVLMMGSKYLARWLPQTKDAQHG